jgi:hypothetical protein
MGENIRGVLRSAAVALLPSAFDHAPIGSTQGSSRLETLGC